MEKAFSKLMRQSAGLYALFLAPTILWLLYIGPSDASLSRHIGDAWQTGFWHFPGLSNTVSRFILDGLEWIAIGLLTWLFIQGYFLLKQAPAEVTPPDASPIQSLISAPGKQVLQWTLLGGLLLLAVIPFHSSDLYGYLNRGFQQTLFHTNPYLTPVAEIPHWEQEPLLHAHWQYNPCPYGFFFALLARVFTSVAIENFPFLTAFLLFKTLNVVLLVGMTGLIAFLSRQLGQTRPWLSAYLFGANPLVLLHAIGNGHNDILMTFLLLAAIGTLLSPRWKWLCLPLLTLSILTKYASLLALPLIGIYLLKNKNYKALLIGATLSIGLALWLAMPYIDPHHAWPWAALLDNAGKPQHSVADMLARMAYYPVKWMHGNAPAAMDVTLKFIKPLFWAGFVGFYAWLWWRFTQSKQTNTLGLQQLIAAIALVMTVLVTLVSAKFHPWYPLMFLPLALLLPEESRLRRFGILFSLFQIAGFTLLQNVHVFNVILLTILPFWLSRRPSKEA